MRALPLFLLLGLSLAAPLSAQARDEPLGEILESIEDAIRPAPSPAPLPVPHAPVPPDGIGTTPLPPSRIDTPFGPPTEAPQDAEGVIAAEALPDETAAAPAPEFEDAAREAQGGGRARARLEADQKHTPLIHYHTC